MINTEEIIKQNLTDLVQVIIIQSEIIANKDLNKADLNRIRYCEKLLKDVTDKSNKLNK